MNTLLKWLMGALVLTVVCVDVRFGWLFGQAFGQTGDAKIVYSTLGAAVTAIKAISLVAIIQAICTRNASAAIAGLCVMVATVGYSVASSIGYAGMNRDTSVQERVSLADAHSTAQSTMARHMVELRDVPSHRSAKTVEADLSVYPANIKSAETKLQRAALQAELANAHEAARLEALIAAERIKVEAVGAAVSGDDPQVAAIASVTGWSVDRIKTMLAIAVPLVVEVVTLLGPAAVLSSMPIMISASVPASAPAPAMRRLSRYRRRMRDGAPSKPVMFTYTSAPTTSDATPDVEPEVVDNSSRNNVTPLVRSLPQDKVDKLNEFFARNLSSKAGGFEMTAGMAAEAEAHLGFPVTLSQVGAILSSLGYERGRFAGMRGSVGVEFIGDRLSGFTKSRASGMSSRA